MYLKNKGILKILKRFMGFIFLDMFCFITFASMVKFSSLAQFEVDCPSHPAVPTFVFLLCQFSKFTNYMIKRFISVTI